MVVVGFTVGQLMGGVGVPPLHGFITASAVPPLPFFRYSDNSEFRCYFIVLNDRSPFCGIGFLGM